MAARHLLYFTGEGHFLYSEARGVLTLEAEFSADEQGVDAFREHLRGREGALFSILADLAGEDFHEDLIPLLRGGDREAVLQRRIAQRYRDTRLAATLSLGTVSSAERRNERLLLASFTNTQSLAPWLDALEESGARLAGVFSPPLLAPALAARLGTRSGRAFVVTLTRAGLRQSYIEDGKLRFARLERTIEMVPQALAMFVRSETLRLAQYLVTLRVLPRDGGPIHALVVAPPGQRGAFEQVLQSDARLVFRTLDGEHAERAVGLRGKPEGTAGEALYLRLAAKNPPREQFASSSERRRYIVWKLQRAVVAAGAVGFAACVLFAGARWLDVVQARNAAEQQAQEAQRSAEAYARITAAFPVTHTSTENLRAAVTEFTRIAQRSATPDAVFTHVSQVLERFPQFELDALNWSVGRPSERREQRAGGAPPKPEAQGADAAAVETIEVSGRVNATQRSDYRGITAQVQRFATALGSAGYELSRTQLPFDITSEGTLTGDIGGAETGEAPRFTVVLTRKLP
jgi:hypothetical protein